MYVLDELFGGALLDHSVLGHAELSLALYAAALVAAALVTVRKGGWRDPVIALVLACVWAWMAMNYWAYAFPVPSLSLLKTVESLLLLQVLLFIGFGVTRRLRFDGRLSPWTIAGSSMLFYALIVHPLLGLFWEPLPFGTAIFGLPFPPIVFTVGLLFFTTMRSRWLLLTIPLLWSALGGLIRTSLDAVQFWTLQVVFLAGCAFIAVPLEAWGGGGYRLKGGELYEHAHRRGRFINIGLWAILSTALSLSVLRSLQPYAGSPPFWLERLIISIWLLFGLAIVSWLAYPAWEIVWFRPLAWRAARAAGAVWQQTRLLWKWGVLLLTALILVEAVGRWLVQNDGEPVAQKADQGAPIQALVNQGKLAKSREGEASLKEQAEFDSLFPDFFMSQLQVQCLVAAFLLGLISVAYRGRKRLVIQQFEDYTGKEAGLENCVKGIDTLLQNELARIADLYRVIDEAGPQKRQQIIEVTAGVQDSGDILKEAAGSGSTFKIFGTEISANFVFGLIGRLVQGPRLVGSLHKEGKQLVLIAELCGGGMKGNWRVDTNGLEKGDRSLTGEAAVQKLVEQMAFRIATEVVSIGSPRWRAVCCFTGGLRAYRETQRSSKDKSINLRRAERCLIEAINDDKQFAQCHYNLGVVYKELGEFDSAESAFRKALQSDGDSYEACYALSETYIGEKKFKEAVWFADAAICINASDARAWDLKAYAQRQYQQKREHIKVAFPQNDSRWQPLLDLREIAVALAWRSLCRQALSGSSRALDRQRDTAFISTRNLAVLSGRAGLFRRSENLFRQVALLVDHDPEIRYSLGKTFFWEADMPKTLMSLEGVFEEGLELEDRGTLWSTLLQAYCRTEQWGFARNAYAKFLDVASEADAENLKQLITFLGDALDGIRRRRRVPQSLLTYVQQRWWAFTDWWTRPPVDWLPAVSQLRQRLRRVERRARRLGWDSEGAGALKRLLRLCRFLSTLENEGNPDADSFGSVQSLQRALDSADREGERLQKKLQRLDDLQAALERVALRDGENPQTFLANPRLLGPALTSPQAFANEAIEAWSKRAEQLQSDLYDLQRTVWPLQKWVAVIREAETEGRGNLFRAEDLLEEICSDFLKDWKWARYQVMLRFARHCLEERRPSPQNCGLALRAMGYLEEVIEKLEAEDSWQVRNQGLYGLLAQAYLVRATHEPEASDRLLRRALAYAERAVEMEPEKVQARLILARVYARLGDYPQARAEASISLDLDASAETLRVAGESFWEQVEAARNRKDRQKVLRDAVEFFEHALKLIENESFNEKRPAEQMWAHGWAHYWLGRFHCELGRYDLGIGHQKIGCSLGFKPVECRVHLIWACFEANLYDDAEQAFLGAVLEADRYRHSPDLKEVADAPGEEWPLGELLTEAYLGGAFLAVERGTYLGDAVWRIAMAESLIWRLEKSKQRRFWAIYHECRGWLYLKQDKIEDSLVSANRSLGLMLRSGAYCCLAKAYLANGHEPAVMARKAREAHDWARELDLRNRYQREIDEICQHVKRIESTHAIPTQTLLSQLTLPAPAG